MTRSAWSAFADEWDPERDPAQIRMGEALALGAPEPPKEPSQPAPVETFREPEPAPPEPSRRDRVAALVARIRNGDLSAIDLLRRLLDGRD